MKERKKIKSFVNHKVRWPLKHHFREQLSSSVWRQSVVGLQSVLFRQLWDEIGDIVRRELSGT